MLESVVQNSEGRNIEKRNKVRGLLPCILSVILAATSFGLGYFLARKDNYRELRELKKQVDEQQQHFERLEGQVDKHKQYLKETQGRLDKQELVGLEGKFGEQEEYKKPTHVAYKEDFFQDPKWETSDNTRFSWQAQEGVFTAKRININGGGNYACYDTGINFQNTSFCLEWDVLPRAIDYASGLAFGMFDTDMNSDEEGSFAMVVFSQEDRGQTMLLSCRDSENQLGHADSLPAKFLNNTWYHVVMQYDEHARVLKADITVRDTGKHLSSMLIRGVGPFAPDMDRIGTSDIRQGRYQVPGAEASGLFDNVELYIQPQEK